MTIEMLVDETTLYVVPNLWTNESDDTGKPLCYSTHDFDKARQMEAFSLAGIEAAECVYCKAVIPRKLVDLPSDMMMDFVVGNHILRVGNQCPANTNRYSSGHRVPIQM